MFSLLQLALVPALIIVILVLIVIIVWLLRELQQVRSARQPTQPVYLPSIYRPSTPSLPDTFGRVGQTIPPQRKEGERGDLGAASPLNPAVPPQPIAPDLDDPLNDKRWLKLVEECVGLFDDLDSHLASFDPPRQQLTDHVLLQLQEILERSDVEIIADDTTFDRHRHQPERTAAGAVPGTPIAKTLSPGFAVEGRVLRRARVRLAEVSS